MAELARLIIDLDGWPGAPGVNVLHFSKGFPAGSWTQQDIDDLLTEIDSNVCLGFYTLLAPNVRIQLRNEVTIFESSNGQIQDVMAGTNAPVHRTSPAGTDGQTPRSTAALVRFAGDRYINGRRLNGRMFLGPLSSGIIADDGMINTTYQDAIADAFFASISGVGVRLAVWRRPGQGLSNGEYADVASVSVRPQPSSLRSRLF